jgi:hypothetical protein
MEPEMAEESGKSLILPRFAITTDFSLIMPPALETGRA